MSYAMNAQAILFAGCLFPGFFSAGVQAQTGDRCYLLIGGYTKASKNKGIAVYEFNTRTGDVQFRSVAGGIENPSYFAVSKDGDKVYAVSEKNTGSVKAYRFDRVSGKLEFMNEASSGGRGPCYISVDDAGTHVFTAASMCL